MAATGLVCDAPITLVAGPEEYLFGEEKALLEVIEGRDPLPRLFPPYEHGLFATAPQTGWESTPGEPGHPGRHESNPTLVNNVETLANVPVILARGPEWFRGRGTEASPGHVVCTVVGDVVAPDIGEVELGTSLREIIDAIASGMPAGRRVKAVFSGVANPVLRGDQLDIPLSYEGFQAAGSGMGAAGFIVYDETACMVEVARAMSRFLYVESCGQCPPCKLGSGEITEALQQIQAGNGAESDVAEIGSWLGKVTDGARCYLATQERQVVGSLLSAFPDEFAAHLEGPCPLPRPIQVAKLRDLTGGVARYDERQARKQPDWTYAE
jgi:NADH:ubiquinone oxidoreductase subunit F (NADH-binding)